MLVGRGLLFGAGGTVNPPLGTWALEQIITGPTVSDNFGEGISIDGDTMAIGASDQSSGAEIPAVYVYTRTAGVWSLEQKIQASGGTAGARKFGAAVTLSGDTLVVGAWQGDSPSAVASPGTVYSYARSGGVWTESQIITSSSEESNGRFGFSVSIGNNGNSLAVGAAREGTGAATGPGIVHVYTKSGNTWVSPVTVAATVQGSFDGFGESVSMSKTNEVLAVGAPSYLVEGAVYVFKKLGTWQEQVRLLKTETSTSTGFGKSVSLYEDSSLMAGLAEQSTNSEAAYIWVSSDGGVNWVEEQQIVAADNDLFGTHGNSVSISGDWAIVGSSFHDHNNVGDNNGGSWRWRRVAGVWTEDAEMLPTLGTPSVQAGFKVYVDTINSFNDVTMAFTTSENGAAENGHVYVYRLS